MRSSRPSRSLALCRWVLLGCAIAVGVALPGRARAVLFSLAPSVGVGYASVTTEVPVTASGSNTLQVKDAFLTFGLAARLRLTGALVSQTFSYTLLATEYRSALIASNLGHTLGWQLTATPTGRTQVVGGLLASRVNTSGASGVDPNTASTTALPVGASTVTTATANESFIYSPTGSQRLSESATVSLARASTFLSAANAMVPSVTNDVTSLLLTGVLHGQRLAGRDTHGVLAQASSVTFLSYDTTLSGGMQQPGAPPPAVPVNPGTIVTAQLLGEWIRQQSASLNTSLQAGAMALIRLGNNQVVMAPAVNAVINYNAQPWFATLTVFQQPVINIFVGNAVIGDGASLRVSLPLDQRRQWVISGVGGYTYGRFVQPGKGFVQWQRGYDLWSFGASSSYTFQKYPIFLSASYVGSRQRGSRHDNVVFPDSERWLFSINAGVALAWGEGNRGFARRQ